VTVAFRRTSCCSWWTFFFFRSRHRLLPQDFFLPPPGWLGSSEDLLLGKRGTSIEWRTTFETFRWKEPRPFSKNPKSSPPFAKSHQEGIGEAFRDPLPSRVLETKIFPGGEGTRGTTLPPSRGNKRGRFLSLMMLYFENGSQGNLTSGLAKEKAPMDLSRAPFPFVRLGR